MVTQQIYTDDTQMEEPQEFRMIPYLWHIRAGEVQSS